MNLVFISYYFPPYNTIASQRSSKIVKQLLDSKHKITVFTIDINDIPEKNIDYEFNKHLLLNLNLTIIRVPISKFGYEDPAKAFFLKKVYSNILTKLFCSNGIFWYKNLKKSLLKFYKNNNVNYIIFTGSPFIIFKIATNLKRKFNAQYILDYRDLWTQNPRTSYYNFARYIIREVFELYIINNAKAIITVSDGCANALRTLIRNTNINVYVIRNLPSSDYVKYFNKIENENKNNEFSNKFRLVIVGTVYKNCTLTPILNALKKIDDKYLDERLSILYYGQSGIILKKEIETYGFNKYFKDFGFVSKRESIKAILSANLLVSLVDDGKLKLNNTITGLMTTKIFDYFLSRLPILNIAPINSDINNFAVEIGYSDFHSFVGDQTSKIASFLECKINNSYFYVKPSTIVNLPVFDIEFEININKIFQ